MMQVLSPPDARDSMSLPYQPIAWGEYDQGVQRLRGLRLGLLLDAGCGLPQRDRSARRQWNMPPACSSRPVPR